MNITTEATGSVPSDTVKIQADATFEIGVTAQERATPSHNN